MEKLDFEDSYVMEIVVNKINEIIDEVSLLEEHFNKRINNLWAYHRRMNEPKPPNGEHKERKPKTEKQKTEPAKEPELDK